MPCLFLVSEHVRQFGHFPLKSRPSHMGLVVLSPASNPTSTMGQNRKKHRINSHLITHFPTSSGVSEVSKRTSEQSEYCGANKRVSSASERAIGEASGPVLQSVFLAVRAHCAAVPETWRPKGRQVLFNGGILCARVCVPHMHASIRPSVHPSPLSKGWKGF